MIDPATAARLRRLVAEVESLQRVVVAASALRTVHALGEPDTQAWGELEAALDELLVLLEVSRGAGPA